VANLSKFTKIGVVLVVISGIALASLVYIDTTVKADYYLKIATSLDENNPSGSTEAIKYYNKAIKSYAGAKDNAGAAKAYVNLGLLHYKFGNSLQVERAVLSAMELGKDNMPEEMQAKAYLLLSSTLEPVKAKEYIAKSLEISQRNHLHALIAQAYVLLGQANEYKANFEAAEESYLKAIDAVQDFSVIDRSFNVRNLYERIAEVYSGGGELDNAIKYYYEALAYTARDERGFATANYMKIIGDLYQEKKNFAKACELWHLAEKEYAFFGAMAPFSISANSSQHTCKIVG
jgi:tetratricopeptide (TPR) repeat protein